MRSNSGKYKNPRFLMLAIAFSKMRGEENSIVIGKDEFSV